MGDVASSVKQAGREARDSTWMDHVARAGLVAYGVVHLLLAWVAFQLALGSPEQEASNTGAFAELAKQPFGSVALGAVALGLALLVVWQALEAAFGHRDEDGGRRWARRAGSAGKALVYAGVSFSAVKVLVSGRSSGSGRSTTATVLGWPAGQALVVLAGLGVLGYAGYCLFQAWTEKFLDKLDGDGRTSDASTAYRWAGRLGYAAKGVAYGIVGGLVVHAGWTHEGGDRGLDDALHTLLGQPMGPFLLGAVAVGLGCYGLFGLARARHLDR